MGTNCPSFELLSAFRDRETTPEESQLVAAHVPACAECVATLNSFQGLSLALSATPAVRCAVARPLISAALDNEVGATERAIVTRHLAACATCAVARTAWESVDAALAALPIAYPSPAADSHIRALAHRRQATSPRPSIRGALGGLALAVATVTLLVVGTLQGGGGPQLGTAPGVGRSIVASAQQIYNPSTGLLYVLEPPKPTVFVRSLATQRTVAAISVGGAPAFLALNKGGNTLYVLDPVARAYTVIDTEENVVRERVPLAGAGTPTSIEVNGDTGKLVVATAAVTSATNPKPAEIAIIDTASKKLDTVMQLEVAPTKIVVDTAANRLFLFGASSLAVLDATTYERIVALPTPVVAVAASARGGPAAIVAERGAETHVTFYPARGERSFSGKPQAIFALPHGGFALLVDDVGMGRIIVLDAEGSPQGTFTVSGSTRQLSFDPATLRFLAVTGETVAVVTSGAVVAATQPPASPQASTAAAATPLASTPVASATPTPSASATPTPPARPTPLVALPSPPPAPSLFPGAILSSVGLYRYEIAGSPISAMVTGSAGRIWFARLDGTIGTIDPASGSIANITRLTAEVSLLAFGGDRLFALDSEGALNIVNTWDLRVIYVPAPFGRSITGMAVATDGRLWLAAGESGGLVVFDPKTQRFATMSAEAVSPSTVSVDGAGRVWFYDTKRLALGMYEPAQRRLAFVPLALGERITSILADGQAAVWLGGASGNVYRATQGSVSHVRTFPGEVIAFAPAPDHGIVVVTKAGESTLYGSPAAGLAVASVGIRSLAVDAAGHIWLADRSRSVLYIAEPRS